MSKHNIRRHIVKQLRHAARGTKLMAELMRKGDAAALHDIRVQVRTINSVLQPFLGMPHMKPLRRAMVPVKAWGGKSNPVRDLEAQLELIEELLPRPYPVDVQDYLDRAKKELQRRRTALARSKRLDKLPRRIAKLARVADTCLRRHAVADLESTVDFACDELMYALRRNCAEAAEEPKQRHKTRIRVKRLRYLIESFHRYMYERLGDFIDGAKLAQQQIGRLRDWQNLRAAMAGEPAMAQWLAGHAELEEELANHARQAMSLLAQKLANSSTS